MCDHPKCGYKDETSQTTSTPKASTNKANENAGGINASENVFKQPPSTACQADADKQNDAERFYTDPLFNKTEWNLDDWEDMYEKMPADTCSGNYSYLLDYADQLLVKEPLRVLLPLCGSSSDLRWLYDRGNTVVGIEGIEKPVQIFFEKNSDLEHTVEDLPSGKLFKTKDGRLQVFVCDITKMEPSILGKFTAVVDSGAYTAITPSDRRKYTDLVTGALEGDYRYFLEVCHDAPADAMGLPHSIPFSQVKKEFGPKRKLKFLQTEDISEEWSVESFFQTLILISPKVTKRSSEDEGSSPDHTDPKSLKSSDHD